MNHPLKYLLTQALRQKWWMLLAASLGFLTIGSAVGLMMTSAWLISCAALHPSIAELQVAIVGVRFFGVSRAVFRYLERLVAHSVTLRLLAQYRVWFFAALTPLVPPQLAFLRSGDLLSRVTADVETLQNFYIRVLAPPLVALMVTVFMAALISARAAMPGLILLIVMLSAGFGVPVLTAWMTRRIGSRRVELESQLAVMALDGVQGLADLMVFGSAPDHFNRLAALHDEFLALSKKQKQILSFQENLVTLLMNTAVAAVLISAASYVEQGLLPGVHLALLALGVMAAFEAFMPLPGAVLQLQEIECAAKRITEIIERRPLPGKDGMGALRPVYDWDGAAKPDIGLSHVTFAYASQDAPVLKDFSLAIPSHGRVIITGPSGSGKSTLINLLLRFHQTDQGEVVVQGRPVSQCNSESIVSRLGIAPQRLHFFSASIRDNLLLARPRATLEEIGDACRRVGMHDQISAMPQGYDAAMGEWGVRFSGGELRRLAVARALLQDKPIYIFDEPIAHLDAEQETVIWDALAHIPGHKTVLVLSHRLPGQGLEKWQIYHMAALQRM